MFNVTLFRSRPSTVVEMLNATYNASVNDKVSCLILLYLKIKKVCSC